MSDVTQLSDEALVEKFSDSSYCKIEGWGDDSGYEPERDELLRRLALRDQQVTLAMCNEAVFDINPVDPDFGLIDKEQVERALAQLPWPHGSGETPPHFEGKAIMQGTAPVVHQGKGTALYASPDDAASTQDAPTEVEDGLDVSCRYGDILRRVPDGIAEMGRVRMSSRERAVEVLQFALCGVEVSGLDPYENLASANELVAALESAGLEIVPANLLDAVIAAVDEAFCYNPVTKRSKIQVARTDVIAAIRAAWEGAMGESDN